MRGAPFLLGGVLVCLVAGAGSAPVGARPQTAVARSVWEGVYTAEQAKRGERQYDEHCARCHQFGLEGDGLDIPSLADDRFLTKWNGRPLGPLFDLMTTSMPGNQPGTLSGPVNADILSYILSVNGFPAGATELGHDQAGLARITFQAVAQTPN